MFLKSMRLPQLAYCVKVRIAVCGCHSLSTCCAKMMLEVCRCAAATVFLQPGANVVLENFCAKTAIDKASRKAHGTAKKNMAQAKEVSRERDAKIKAYQEKICQEREMPRERVVKKKTCREKDVKKKTCRKKGSFKKETRQERERERERHIYIYIHRCQKNYVRKATCREKRTHEEKKHAKGKRDVKKKMPRLQEKEISMQRHAEKNGCQERDMPKEKDT